MFNALFQGGINLAVLSFLFNPFQNKIICLRSGPSLFFTIDKCFRIDIILP